MSAGGLKRKLKMRTFLLRIEKDVGAIVFGNFPHWRFGRQLMANLKVQIKLSGTIAKCAFLSF